MRDDETELDWAAIRGDYENSKLTVDAIMEKFGVSRTRLYAVAQEEAWTPRQYFDRSGRRGVIARMRRVLERQLTFMEAEMDGSSDKEVALLGNMVKTLEKLIELDAKDKQKEPGKQQSREMADLRKKLAARIDRLKKEQ